MNAHPLAALQQAEARLLDSIQAATAKLDQVGTDALGTAVARLRSAAMEAGDRLGEASRAVADVTNLLLGQLRFLAGVIEAGVEPTVAQVDTLPAIPTVEQAPAHIARVEPSPVEVVPNAALVVVAGEVPTPSETHETPTGSLSTRHTPQMKPEGKNGTIPPGRKPSRPRR